MVVSNVKELINRYLAPNGGEPPDIEGFQKAIAEDPFAGVIARLLHYSYREIFYDFTQVTPVEREILRDQATLDLVKAFVLEHGDDTIRGELNYREGA